MTDYFVYPPFTTGPMTTSGIACYLDTCGTCCEPCCPGGTHYANNLKRISGCVSLNSWQYPVDCDGNVEQTVYGRVNSAVGKVILYRFVGACAYATDCGTGDLATKGVLAEIYASNQTTRLGWVAWAHVKDPVWADGTVLTPGWPGIDWGFGVGKLLTNAQIPSNGCYRNHHTHMQAKKDLATSLTRVLTCGCGPLGSNTQIYKFVY